MNKFLAITCLAAVAVAKPEADAEADPALLYGAYGYAPYAHAGLGYGYAGLGHAGLGYAGLGHAGLGYAGHGYAGLGYGLGLAGYASHSPSASTHIAGLAPAAIPAIAGGYAGAGRYVANSAGVVHIAKREADAEPEAEADPALLYGAYGYGGLGAYGYSGLGYAGLGHAGLGYAGLGHAGLGYAGLGHAGLGYAGYAGYPYAAGYAAHSPSASTHIAGLAPAAIPAIAGGYAGAGRYVANSAGVVHIAKREADAEPEAEADPALLYGAYGYAGHGYGYAGLGYAGLGYAGLGHAGLGYAGLGHAGLGYAGYAGYPYAAGYAAHSPSASTHIAGLAPAAIPAIAGGYAGAGRYIANSAGVIHVA